MSDGGPAFPQNDAEINRINNLDGMSLRDYFAAKAMQGMLSSESNGDGMMLSMKPGGDTNEWLLRNAERAYQIADAMLAARQKGPTQ